MENEIKQWATTTTRQMRLSSMKFVKGKKRSPITKTVNIKGGNSFEAIEQSLRDSFEYKIFKKRGDIEGIRIRYAYHGFFKERGYGRGGKTRTPEPFITPVLAKKIPELADQVAVKFADQLVKKV